MGTTPPQFHFGSQKADLHILHLTRELHTDKRYGIGRAVSQLCLGLRHLDIHADSYCSGDLDAEALSRADKRAERWAARHGSVFEPLFDVISRAWETGAQAATWASSRGHTHVHCHDSVVALGYLQAAGKQALPWGVTQHGFDTMSSNPHRYVLPLPRAMRTLLLRVERDVLGRAHWVVFLSHQGVQQVASGLGMAALPHWHMIPHARPRWQLPDKQSARQRLGWDASEKVLLAVGQLIALKRFDWIVRAMKGAPPGWRLALLGEGDARSMLDLAASIGLPEPLTAVTDDPRDHYAAADAFGSASATESFGMAHLEALLAGLPVACTAVGGVPELVGDAALLLPDDELAYADGLCRFLRDDDSRAALSERSRLRAAAWPSIEQVASAHVGVYSNRRQ